VSVEAFVQALARVVALRWTRLAIAWFIVLAASAIASYYAWGNFRNDKRADGNGGHTAIDFAGQWLMGRMLVEGHGRELYVRSRQLDVLRAAYPVEDQEPDQKRDDAEQIQCNFMGKDLPEGQSEVDRSQPRPLAGIGGPLYPPINAFYYSPLALLRPRLAYRVNQGLNLALAFLCGLAARQLSRGRFWWPLATTFVFIFPGYAGSIDLGQNATLTLSLLLWGWLFAARGRPVAGGIVWGFLAFKPVWAVAFFLVPLLTRRWRMAAAMVLTGLLLTLATIPFVGIDAWFDWLQVGKEAAKTYETDQNWIFLSRDLLSVPRRWLVNFDTEDAEQMVPRPLLTAGLSWAAWGVVAGGTLVMAWVRRQQARNITEREPAAFLLLGAWMLCYHFMYYDSLLAALPVFLLLTEPRRFLIPRLLGLIQLNGKTLPSELAAYYEAESPKGLPGSSPVAIGPNRIWVLNSFELTLIALMIASQYAFPHLGWGASYGPPWDTLCLFILWLWCGGCWLIGQRSEPSGA
jgi:arabinofuranan 3-O-arabinosyltransferase